MAGEIKQAISSLGLGNLGLGSAVNKFMLSLSIFIGIAGLIYLIYWIRQRQKYNIVIRGHDLRGNQDFEFDDKAREFITINRAELKLLKRKHANVIIPNLKYYRSMVDGRRVLHAFKFGAVNDYVILDPQIVIDTDKVKVLDDKGKPALDKDGKEIIINKTRYDLHITESLGKEHSIRDLRDAIVRFKIQGTVEKYKEIICIIILGVIMIVTAWIYGHYMLKTAGVINDGYTLALEGLKQIKSVGNIV